MINPINLIKIDDTRDSNGKTFHVGPLPEYDLEDYDLSNPKDFEKYIKDIKSFVRGSFEYREMVKYLKEYGGMDRSGISPDITNSDGSKVKIEIHHTPFVLEDIVRIVYEKRLSNHEDLSVPMVAKEVMECHYKGLVGLYPLTSTEHELVHNGYVFIPPNNVFGQYTSFMNNYDPYIDPQDKETIYDIEQYAKEVDTKEQTKILTQSTIHIDPNGAYLMPHFSTLRDAMSNRIDTIRNNMYTLPVMNENVGTSVLKEAVYFVDKNGDRIDESIS